MPSHKRDPRSAPDFSGAVKPWRVVKVQHDADDAIVARVVLSAHDKQEVAEAHAGEGRDALTDAEVGAGWNVVAERRARTKR